MSLHCPATLALLAGAEAAVADPGALRRLRIATVYDATAPGGASDGAAESDAAPSGVGDVAARLSAALGAPVRSAPAPDGVQDARDLLESIADVHRGEHVLLLLDPGVRRALGRVALDRRGPAAQDGPCRLVIGDDDWTLLDPEE